MTQNQRGHWFIYAGVLCLMLSLILFVGTVKGEVVSTAERIKTVNLAWDASPDDRVTGYTVIYKSELDPAQVRKDVGPSLKAEITGLDADTAHHFVVIAYDDKGNESVPSNEVISPKCIELTPPTLQIQTHCTINTVNNYFGR